MKHYTKEEQAKNRKTIKKVSALSAFLAVCVMVTTNQELPLRTLFTILGIGAVVFVVSIKIYLLMDYISARSESVDNRTERC